MKWYKAFQQCCSSKHRANNRQFSPSRFPPDILSISQQNSLLTAGKFADIAGFPGNHLQFNNAAANLPLKSLCRRLFASSTQFAFLVTNISTLPTADHTDTSYYNTLAAWCSCLGYQYAGCLQLTADTLATLKRAATNLAAWWTEAWWVRTVCLRLLTN